MSEASLRNQLGSAVDHPSHYNQGGIECIDALEAALTHEEFIGFLRGNAIKYLWRARHKGGAQDLAKADGYNDRLQAFIAKGDGKIGDTFIQQAYIVMDGAHGGGSAR